MNVTNTYDTYMRALINIVTRTRCFKKVARPLKRWVLVEKLTPFDELLR